MTTLVFADIAAAAALRRWLGPQARVVDEVTRSHSELGCVRFETAQGTQISVLEDHVGEVAYATVEGPHAPRWCEAIAADVQCLGVPGVLAMLGLGADPRQWIRGLSRLALLRGEKAEPILVQAWARALEHPHPAVRRAAIRTCYGARWPELRALAVTRTGVDLELRTQLERLVQHLDRLMQAPR